MQRVSTEQSQKAIRFAVHPPFHHRCAWKWYLCGTLSKPICWQSLSVHLLHKEIIATEIRPRSLIGWEMNFRIRKHTRYEREMGYHPEHPSDVQQLVVRCATASVGARPLRIPRVSQSQGTNSNAEYINPTRPYQTAQVKPAAARSVKFPTSKNLNGFT